MPAVTITSLYLIFGNVESQWTHLLDETAVWLIIYMAPNLGVITQSLGLQVFLFSAIFSSANNSSSTWILLLLYTLIATYTHFFQITEGVEVVRNIYPLWRGTKSGLLWPAIFYMTGLVDEDDEAAFVEKDEEKPKRTKPMPLEKEDPAEEIEGLLVFEL